MNAPRASRAKPRRTSPCSMPSRVNDLAAAYREGLDATSLWVRTAFSVPSFSSTPSAAAQGDAPPSDRTRDEWLAASFPFIWRTARRAMVVSMNLANVRAARLDRRVQARGGRGERAFARSRPASAALRGLRRVLRRTSRKNSRRGRDLRPSASFASDWTLRSAPARRRPIPASP